MEVDQCVRGDSVEGQSASRTVHIHCCSVREEEEEEEEEEEVSVPLLL